MKISCDDANDAVDTSAAVVSLLLWNSPNDDDGGAMAPGGVIRFSRGAGALKPCVDRPRMHDDDAIMFVVWTGDTATAVAARYDIIVERNDDDTRCGRTIVVIIVRSIIIGQCLFTTKQKRSISFSISTVISVLFDEW